MRPAEDLEQAEHEERHLDELAKKGRSAAEFVAAIRGARQACEEAGLNANWDAAGNANFTPFQTAKTVRHTREDVSATLALQLFILRRLDRNRNYMLVIIIMLIYIALKLNK